MGNPNPLSEFLEEQLWAVRDRADSLQSVPLARAAASKLALTFDELAHAALLLRRRTGVNRAGVAALIARMRKRLESIERDAWPDQVAV